MSGENEIAAIETFGLSKRYGSVLAVDGLSLSVRQGEIFALLGPNGAGKSSTILMLMGLTEPTAGTCRVLGLSPLNEALEIKRRVGYLPENVGFYNGLSARQNLRFIAELNGLKGPEAEETIENAIEGSGLKEAAGRRVAGFSRGMRQRLGLAELLIKSPEILFLDEPTLGLDPDGIEGMLTQIKKLSSSRGLTVIFSSHLLHLVEQVADRVAILKRGRLMALGSIPELAAEAGLAPKLTEIYRRCPNPGQAPL